MNVFLPVPSFAHSVAMLDDRRANKQALEAMQMLGIMQRLNAEQAVPPLESPATSKEAVKQFRRAGYSAHPAVRAWRGYEPALALYMAFGIRDWLARGYKNTKIIPYTEDWLPNPEFRLIPGLPPAEDVRIPPWVGDNLVHATHRSNLLRKDEAFYSQYGWSEGTNLSYIWPDPADYGDFQ